MQHDIFAIIYQYRGMILSSVLECQKVAEDGLKMLLARRQREGMKVSAGDVTQCVQLMLDSLVFKPMLGK